MSELTSSFCRTMAPCIMFFYHIVWFKKRGEYFMEDVDKRELGFRIYCLRKEKGYSRETLAELADISSGFLYEIEVGKKGFSALTLKLLSNALNVSSDYLLFGSSHSNYEDDIIDTIEKFEPGHLEKVKELLQLIYDISK